MSIQKEREELKEDVFSAVQLLIKHGWAADEANDFLDLLLKIVEHKRVLVEMQSHW